MPETLHLPEQIRAAILAHTDWCAPDECCGLIATDSDGRVRFAYPLTNAAPSPVTYTIEPNEHFGALTHAESQGWEIGGVFHSHPKGPPTPSMVDVQQALDSEWVYLVASPGEIRGFRIRGGEVREIELG